jgi:nucleotide-binding universal stress UspA family protein
LFTKIIVALDRAELCDRVLSAVDSLSLSDGAKIILTHVLPENDSETTLDRPHDSREIAEERLRTYQSRFPISSEIEVLDGDPAEEIIRLAHIHHADLIVIGSRGLTGVKRVIEGSVSAQVVDEASCSVFVVKS